MFKALISIILLALSVVIFFTKSQVKLEETKTLRDKADAYNEALSNARKIKETTNKLLNKYNAIDQEDMNKINTILPSRFDSVKLAVELENTLGKNNMSMKSVSFKEAKPVAKKTASKTKSKKKEAPYETASVSLQINGSYESFYSFLKDAERGLRLLDINSIKFSAGNANTYDFDLDISTYWLKETI